MIDALKAIKGLGAGNVAIVFTCCDGLDMMEINKSGIPRYKAWLDALKKTSLMKIDGGDAFCNTGADRVFFFSGEAGKSGPKTTQNELIGFIKQHI